MNRTSFQVILLFVVVSLTGCQSLERRIADHADFFDGLTTEHQNLIRVGSIRAGFTQQEVFLAWGSYNHQKKIHDSDGERKVWIYTTAWQEGYTRPMLYDDDILPIWRPFRFFSTFPVEFVVKDAVFENDRLTAWHIYAYPFLYVDFPYR